MIDKDTDPKQFMEELGIDDPELFWNRFNDFPKIKITEPQTMHSLHGQAGHAIEAICGKYITPLVGLIRMCESMDFTHEESRYNMLVLVRYMNYRFGGFDRVLMRIDHREYTCVLGELFRVFESCSREEIARYIQLEGGKELDPWKLEEVLNEIESNKKEFLLEYIEDLIESERDEFSDFLDEMNDLCE